MDTVEIFLQLKYSKIPLKDDDISFKLNLPPKYPITPL